MDDNRICNCRSCNGVVHEIKSGDTLYSLGRFYNVSVSSIIKANRGINPYNLMIGDRICIPMNRYRDYNIEYSTDDINNENMNTGMNMGMNGNPNGNMNTGMNMGMNGNLNGNMNTGMNMGMNGNLNGNMNTGMNSSMNDNIRKNMGNNINDMNDRNSWGETEEDEFDIEFTGLEDEEKISGEMMLSEVMNREDMTVGKFAEILRNI